MGLNFPTFKEGFGPPRVQLGLSHRKTAHRTVVAVVAVFGCEKVNKRARQSAGYSMWVEVRKPKLVFQARRSLATSVRTWARRVMSLVPTNARIRSMKTQRPSTRAPDERA